MGGLVSESDITELDCEWYSMGEVDEGSGAASLDADGGPPVRVLYDSGDGDDFFELFTAFDGRES